MHQEPKTMAAAKTAAVAPVALADLQETLVVGGNNSNGGGRGSGGGGSGKSPTGAIIGGSIGGVALALILAALAAYVRIRSRSRKSEVQRASVYLVTDQESHRAYFANNMYDSAPPYYQHATSWNNGSSGKTSTSENSSDDLPTHLFGAVDQKLNTPVQAEFQKPK